MNAILRPDFLGLALSRPQVARAVLLRAHIKLCRNPVRVLSGRLSGLSVFYSKTVSMALCYGRAGRLAAKNGGFWPGQRWGRCLEVPSECLHLASEYAMKLVNAMQASHGRHCHSTLSLTVSDCQSSGIYILILLSFSAKITVSPVANAGHRPDWQVHQDDRQREALLVLLRDANSGGPGRPIRDARKLRGQVRRTPCWPPGACLLGLTSRSLPPWPDNSTRFPPTSRCICTGATGSYLSSAPLADRELSPQVLVRRREGRRLRRHLRAKVDPLHGVFRGCGL
jgi:hypothetical protein